MRELRAASIVWILMAAWCNTTPHSTERQRSFPMLFETVLQARLKKARRDDLLLDRLSLIAVEHELRRNVLQSLSLEDCAPGVLGLTQHRGDEAPLLILRGAVVRRGRRLLRRHRPSRRLRFPV